MKYLSAEKACKVRGLALRGASGLKFRYWKNDPDNTSLALRGASGLKYLINHLGYARHRLALRGASGLKSHYMGILL